MKILRLDMKAFGPFTDKSLDLHEGQYGLHIVYGPNEAGKSSSLRALRQWLYGIPHASDDNFIHTHTNLRIGGLLERANGERLEFIRRKGRSNTLRAGDDSGLVDPARLNDMLDGVNEATFCKRFGIDYDELRKGGEAVVRGGGDLGEILFAAGAGVADLGLILKGLDEEAEKLFKPKGQNQRINKAVADFEATRKTINVSQLRTADWLDHDQKLREAGARHAKIESELKDKRATLNRLERIDKALPWIGRRKRTEARLAEVADARVLPADFTVTRHEVVAELANARQAERDAQKEIETLQAAMANLDVPVGMVEHRTAITRLHTDMGSYRKAAKDRPSLVERLESIEKRACSLLRDLGREPDFRHVDQLRLRSTHRHAIQSLAGDYSARLESLAAAERAVRKLSDEIKRLESQLAALPPTRNATELKQTVRRVQKHGDLDQQLADARVALQAVEKQAEIAFAKLPYWKGTHEQLERMPVPAPETIERFENEMNDATAAVKASKQSIDELSRQVQVLDQKLETFRLERDVPTEEDLALARQRRSHGWQLVQRVWMGAEPADEAAVQAFIDDSAPGADLARAFQACIDATDVVADRLRREADRVAVKAKLATDRLELDRRLVKQREILASEERALELVQSQWRRQWTGLDVEPHSPREMRSWLNQQRTLTQLAESIRNQRAALDQSEAGVRTHRAALSACLAALDQPTPAETDALGRILECCETLIHEIETANRKRLGSEESLQKSRLELAETERIVEQSKRDLEKWRLEWAQAVATLGLSCDAKPSEANSVIETVDELNRLFTEANDVRSRIEGIDRDADEFRQSVQRMLAQVAADLTGLVVDQAVADLVDRLAAASTAKTRLDGWKEQLEAEVKKRDAALSKIERLEARIAALCQQAGCAAADDLPAAEQRSALRRQFEEELKTVDERLGDLAAGALLHDWVADAEKFDPDQLRADLLHSNEEIARLDQEKKPIAEAIGRHQNELERMNGGAQAAEGQERAEQLLACIRGDAEQYVRLRLASVILRRSIERFRESSQGPVLARAGELFQELTLGSFEGLRADYDDKGNAVLVGVRAGSKQSVGVEGMSAGACDQLYFALRLALLESCLTGREPLPFIVDDILIMFDDGRANATLKALARLSEKTQVIFFTHHEHLVQLARKHLDPTVLFTQTLGEPAFAPH